MFPQIFNSVYRYNVLKLLVSNINGLVYRLIKNTETILNNLGMSNGFLSRIFPSVKVLINYVKERQRDTFLQKWNSDISSSSKGVIFKEKFE